MSSIFPPGRPRAVRLQPRHPALHERISLLDGIGGSPSGRRRFCDGDNEWLGVLRCLRDTGMLIAQMRRFGHVDLAILPTNGLCIRPVNLQQVVSGSGCSSGASMSWDSGRRAPG